MLDARIASQPDQVETQAQPTTWDYSGALVGVLLALVMLVGGYFRFVGQNWDDYVHFHPDERGLTDAATRLDSNFLQLTGSTATQDLQTCLDRYPNSNGVGAFFDALCSTWNPHNAGKAQFFYGTFPLFAARLAAELTAQTTQDPGWIGYDQIDLVWRFLSAVADMIVILAVFFIGVQLHGKWTGLLAATLYAGAVFPIQVAHFGTADAITTMCVALGILFAVRAQNKGRLLDYALFGIACGAAVASRVNTAPLVGVIVLAGIVRMLPGFDRTLAEGERERVIIRTIIGLILAALTTFVTFRILNPYAFMGPGFFGISLNPRWLADVSEAQNLVSGNVEFPPNWQWVGRTPYLFPLNSMVLWGLGIGLGVAGWLAWVWSGYRLIRGRGDAIRNAIPFAWILVYFGWLGRLWVMSMRYYLPIYPALAVMAAWGLVELVRRAAQRRQVWRKIVAYGLTTIVTGFTLLWAIMFTNIYRHQFSVVQATDWVYENVPGDFAMRIENSSAPLINIALPNRLGQDNQPQTQATSFDQFSPSYSVTFTAPASGTITTILAPHLGDPLDDPGPETMQFTILRQSDNQQLSQATLTDNFARDKNVMGNSYTIPLDTPLTVVEGQNYIFNVAAVSGGPVISSGATMAWEGDWDEVVPAKACTLPPGMTLADDPPPGMFTPQTCNGRDPWSALLNGYKQMIFYEDTPDKRDLMIQQLDNTDYIIIGTNRRYDSQSRNRDRWPMTNRYYQALFSGELGYQLVGFFQETFQLGPLRISDQVLPTYHVPEWLNEFESEEAFTVYDHPAVFIFQRTAAYSSDNTRRILDSVALTQVNQAHVHYSCPDLTQEDLANYDCDPTIVGVDQQTSLAASAAPNHLELSPEMRDIQYSGGTWSERFDINSLVNTQPAVLLVIWWLTIVVAGWAAWPLLFGLLPGLADRGYGFAKLAGLFISGWLAWYVSSLRVPMWSQTGLALAMGILALVSILMAIRSRAELVAYLRSSWQRLVWIEVITLICFVGFLAVRLTNPDLWHPNFGGEKPMDFAYFNAVLRSTIFPPLDPWFAGGYINYYYFGYVIVGVPVLMLGVVPSVAYNLIVPTLYAVLAIGSFSVAFNLVSGWRERQPDDEEDPHLPAPSPGQSSIAGGRGAKPLVASLTERGWGEGFQEGQGVRVSRRMGNPWVAGIAALMLTVVLGNLDTPRVFGEGLLHTGFYQNPGGLASQLAVDYSSQHGGLMPSGQAVADINNQAISDANSMGSSLLRGVMAVLSGKPLDEQPNRWYWMPTRILSEPPVDSGQAIAEMPYFTFLYGDLHAHMIAMPVQIFVMGLILNELLLAGSDKRKRAEQILALALMGLAVGMLRAINTWDWPTFMLLTLAGLVFSWWLSWRGINRRSLVNLVARVVGFILFSIVFSLPYTTWYASVYNSLQPWVGNKTPLWAYLDVHGLFLFLVISLLVWDTARWLRTIYVRSLRGKATLLVIAQVMLVIVLTAAILLAVIGYPVTVVAIPLLVWIGVLFFRSGQSRQMQFALALMGLAIGLTLGVEYVVVQGDVGRQNTVFKFYIQAWLLLSVAGGAAFAWLIGSAPRWSEKVRGGWLAMAAVLVTIAGLYPVMATRGRAQDRMDPNTPPTLDGMTYLLTAVYGENNYWFNMPDEYNLIHWLQENIQGTPIIMEGQSTPSEYHWDGRISIYTGLPSVIGWNWHQRQQRTFDPMPLIVEMRASNVNAFYSTVDVATAWQILQHYDVGYVIVGSLEKAYYPTGSLGKLDRMVGMGLLTVMYHQGDATVYRVNKNATPPPETPIPFEVGG